MPNRFVFVSTEIAHLPPAGVDAGVDEAVFRGLYRDVQLAALPDGKQIRVCRTKGVSYRNKRRGIIYFTPALILNGIFIVHNVLYSLGYLCQDAVVGSTT